MFNKRTRRVLTLGICRAGTATLLAAAAPASFAVGPQGPGGGEFAFPRQADEITPEQRRDIWREIDENVARLWNEGKLPPLSFAHPLFIWPLVNWNGLTHYGNHGISGFVDQDSSFPNQLRDYNCGARTYDTAAGYNHQGDDIFTWPFGWLKMDNSQVAVVAGAPGTIILRSDGNFDRSCAFNNNNWNAVYVRHADNSIAWYGHLKNGSVTPKVVGQTVAQGEYLGIVGSSGNSTGPHLHLEVYDSGGTLDETYSGACNSMNATSWWSSQRPYYDSAVNHLSTNSAPPTWPACPAQEQPNEQTDFAPGDPIYFVTYYRDQLAGQVSTYRIYQPDGALFTQWQHSSAASHYAASYRYWSYGSFPGTMLGTWRFEVNFQSQTYVTYFNVLVSGSPPAGRVQPITVDKAAGGQVTISWPPSCLPGDFDYSVFEGPLGVFSNHVAVICTTGGASSYTYTSAFPMSSYFLITPHNGINEGSLGTDSSGTPRSQGTSPCRARVTVNCP